MFVTLPPVYDYLKRLGAQVRDEHLIIGGWPIQFLVPAGGLVGEALDRSVKVELNDVHTYVFTAEYLAAIALQTGRGKDKARLALFVEEGVLDQNVFRDILSRYQLTEKWTRLQPFLTDDL